MSLARRNKIERRSIIAEHWTRPVSSELDVVDKGKCLEVHSSSQVVATWWLGTLKAMYPQDNYKENGDFYKLHPESGVSLKLNRLDGTLTIKGKKHLQWFKDHFNHMLAAGTTDINQIKETTGLIDTYLRIDDGIQVSELLERIPTSGCIRHSPTFIYRLWKGLLDQWIRGDNRIHVVTPLIDSKRLADLYLTIAKHKLSKSRVQLFTTPRSDGDQKFPKVVKAAKDMIRELKNTTKKRLIVEERLSAALERLDTKFGSFHCKFIACVQTHFTEILSTSASFHAMHFHFEHVDTILFMRMHTEDFINNYLEPLGLAPISKSGSAPILSQDNSI